jgi:hypothetical protein
VSLNEILYNPDEKILPREKINEEHVNNLVKALKEGAELPLKWKRPRKRLLSFMLFLCYFDVL